MSEFNFILVRHAERDKGGDHITSKGKEDARQFGLRLADACLPARTLGLHTSRVRTLETLKEILVGATLTDINIEKEDLLQNYVSPDFDEQWTQREQKDKNAGVNYYLQFGNIRPDADTISPREIARNVSQLILRYVNRFRNAPSSATNYVFGVTHSGIVELFLAYVIPSDNRGTIRYGFGAVEEIGGILDYLEFIHLRFTLQDDGDIASKLYFRRREFGIDISRLAQLAETTD